MKSKCYIICNGGYICNKNIYKASINYSIIKKKELTMAKPIELGLVLEGEDAKEFFRNEKNPVVSKKMVGMFKRAKKIHENNRF